MRIHKFSNIFSIFERSEIGRFLNLRMGITLERKRPVLKEKLKISDKGEEMSQ